VVVVVLVVVVVVIVVVVVVVIVDVVVLDCADALLSRHESPTSANSAMARTNEGFLTRPLRSL
jgi:hypothetical protein